MRLRRPLLAIAFALLLTPVPRLAAQAPVPLPPPRSPNQSAAAAPQPHRATSTPNAGDLSIFETPGRDERLHIQKVMDVLAITPGKSVADIGAASGWFTARAAKRIGNAGEVYAVDINSNAVEYIDERAKKEHLTNVKTVFSKPDDPRLPANSVDAVLMLKTYHEISEPIALLRNLRPALRPGARVGIIDRDGNGTDHGIHKQTVLREADQAGYRLIEEHDDLVKGDEMDYFLILGVK
jgi:SAM-dependent methyltransferase